MSLFSVLEWLSVSMATSQESESFSFLFTSRKGSQKTDGRILAPLLLMIGQDVEAVLSVKPSLGYSLSFLHSLFRGHFLR